MVGVDVALQFTAEGGSIHFRHHDVGDDEVWLTCSDDLVQCHLSIRVGADVEVVGELCLSGIPEYPHRLPRSRFLPWFPWLRLGYHRNSSGFGWLVIVFCQLFFLFCFNKFIILIFLHLFFLDDFFWFEMILAQWNADDELASRVQTCFPSRPTLLRARMVP